MGLELPGWHEGPDGGEQKRGNGDDQSDQGTPQGA